MSRPRLDDRRCSRHWDRLGILGLVLTVVAAVGCDSGPRRYPIRGEVTFDGVAVDTGTIKFHPIEGTKGPVTGSNIEEGRYEVPEEKGPLEGEYRVQIEGLRATGKMRPNMAGEMTVKELVPFTPPEFGGTTSTLRVEIGPDSEPVQDFPLEKK